MSDPEILYEDNHLIVVNKKSSDLVQKDRTGDIALDDQLKSYLKEKYNKPGNVFLGVVHRIDRPTSGVVLFAKTSKMLTRLNKMFREQQITKNYWAVVKNCPDPVKGRLENLLLRNGKQNKSYCVKSQQKDAKHSVLEYELIASSDHYHLLNVFPKTGRHHQIRCQLAYIGCPIKGDMKYGFPRPNSDNSIHLHARSATFIHPVSNHPMTIVAPTPNEILWQSFEKQINELGLLLRN